MISKLRQRNARRPSGQVEQRSPAGDEEGRRQREEIMRQLLRQPDVARRLVLKAVARNAADWAGLVGLPAKGERFAQFKNNVAEALHAGLRAHFMPPAQRLSNLTAKLRRVADLAIDMAPKLLELDALLDELRPPFGHHHRFGYRRSDLSDQARALLDQRLDPKTLKREEKRELPPLPLRTLSLAAAARRFAEVFQDKGGASKKYPAFNVLLNGDGLRLPHPERDDRCVIGNGLAHAFEQATGRKANVTWSDYRGQYEGDFVSLVEAVLPIARGIAERVSPGRPLLCPNNVGAYFYEATPQPALREKKRKPRRR
jgi:hypothetical protein